jgi:AraC family transcriptional regulator
MVAAGSAAVRAISEEKIREIVPVLPYRTSCHLNWSGIEVHRYRLETGESREHTYSQLMIFVPHVDKPVRVELDIEGAHFQALLDNNVISIMPPGLRITGRRFGPFELTTIILDPLAVAEIARAATGFDFPEVLPQVGIADPLVRSIAMRLDEELISERPCPQVYVDSLRATLAAHIFAKYTRPASADGLRSNLNRSQLRHVTEFINEHIHADLALSALAEVAGMSKYHFAKSFRRVMGIAPHQYVVKMRIERARRFLLSEDAASIADIAHRVGYEDPTFFATQFVKLVGVSPVRYRMTL